MSEPAPRENLLGSLVGLLGLMLILGLGVALYGLRVQTQDSRGLYEDLMRDDAELPHGFELIGGTAVAGKQRWVRLAPPSEGGDAVPVEVDGVVIPESVDIGRYPGPVPVRRQFDVGEMPRGESFGRRFDEWQKDSTKTFLGVLNTGVVEFGPFETDFVHLRQHLESGEAFELIRVDMTTPTDAQVLIAHWPPGFEGASVDTLVPFFDAIRLPDPAALAERR